MKGKRKKIFISARMDPDCLEKLRSLGDVDHYDWGAAGAMLAPEELGKRMSAAEVMISESDAITAEMMKNAPGLSLIVMCRGTIINVDLEAAEKLGIRVVNTPGRNADSVADLTVAFMIMVARHILPAHASMAAGEWVKLGKRTTYLNFQGTELYDRTAGLVGFGAIGRRVAERLRGFHMKILACDPFVSPEEAGRSNVSLADLDTLFRESDFISLHAAVTSNTRGMIGAREFSLMKPSAYFINTARAELLDEGALIEALQQKRFAGAALDVYMAEPLPLDNPLYTLDNVLCTPHIGGASRDVITHQSRMAVGRVVDFLESDGTQ